MNDISLWDELKKTVKPLFSKATNDRTKKELPPRLKVRRVALAPISNTLNLHGFTVEEAYQKTKKFIDSHYKKGSGHITVITGKGLHREGLIKKEIALWFDTPFFSSKINSYTWKNDGGALDIMLKRMKK